MNGRVIRAYGKSFVVLCDGAEYSCVIMSKARHAQRETPVAVGDVVEFTVSGDNQGGIEYVHPRKTKFSRPKVGDDNVEQVIVANVDQMVIVVSVAQPVFKQHLIDRFTVSAFKGGLRPVVVINKVDLKHKVDISRMKTIYASINIPCVATSCADDTGAEELRALLSNHESMFVGHSGTGKSSLVNMLQPGLKLRTGVVSQATDKGTHTTTAVEIHPLDGGGFVADTPGLKILGLWDIEKNELGYLFPEFEDYRNSCRFSRCSHLHEPQCAVRQA
ncbi:MAG: ribosome small subunit-dependent GTPase A, partial [Candidatus Zixiibacteriota bacterium]